MQVKDAIRRITDILKDPTGVRWSTAELVRWWNDAMLAAATLRPDQFVVCEPLILVAGTRQALPSATAIKLVDIPNNTASPKAPVRQIERAELDAVAPGWRAATPSAVIKHFIHDMRAPLQFEVYPPAQNGTQLDVLFAKYPTRVDEPAPNALWSEVVGTVAVPDLMVPALIDYVLARAFSKDAEHTINQNRAQAHLSAFANTLGVDVTSLATVSPGVSSPGSVATK